MQLEILTFCDAAAEYGGRLNILGATDNIVTAALPLKYPNCAVVARLRAARIEEGAHTMRLMIIDADGNPVLNVEGKMEIRFHQGMGGAVNLIINAQQLEFKEAGEYALEVAVDGIQVGSSALFVHQREPAAVQASGPPAANQGGQASDDGTANGGPADAGGSNNGGRRIL
ncbi:MAG: hypothetical protein R2932_03390 [Caldilineaceae bacterium]